MFRFRMRKSFPCGSLLMLCLTVNLSACRKAPPPTDNDQAAPTVQLTGSSQSTALFANSQIVSKEDAGDDWPCFLGPHHNGISDETDLLDVWPPEGPPLLWDLSVGTGYSAPSVRAGRLVLHHRLEDEEIVECLNAGSGKRIWKYAYPSHFKDPYGYNNGPRCTPLLTKSRCYTFGAEGKLLCIDFETGKPVWQHDLRSEFEIPEGFFGVGATPLLEGNKLIVAVGGQPNSGLVAFSADTGKQLWNSVGKTTWDGADTGWPGEPQYEWTGEEALVSYSSPLAATIHGQRMVLCLMRQGLVAVSPETGDEFFHYWFRSRAHESVNAAMPVVVNDTILLGAAYRVGSALLRVSPDGRSVETLWKDPRNFLTHWSTAIFDNGCYFGFSGRHENEGQLQCVDAQTGKVLWETTGWDRPQDLQQDAEGHVIDRQTEKVIPWPFYGRGSAILADGKLIILGERGTLSLVYASSKSYQEISRCAAPRMEYPSWTAPVLSGGKLYLRSENSLVCLQISQPATKQ